MLIWMIFLGIGVGLEGYAILTKERYFPTLSRTLWKLLIQHKGAVLFCTLFMPVSKMTLMQALF